MKVYKVTWQTFEYTACGPVGITLSGMGYLAVSKEKYFGSEEAADNFAIVKRNAASELELFNHLLVDVKEMELEE